jgi:hypothetical protein
VKAIARFIEETTSPDQVRQKIDILSAKVNELMLAAQHPQTPLITFYTYLMEKFVSLFSLTEEPLFIPSFVYTLHLNAEMLPEQWKNFGPYLRKAAELKEKFSSFLEAVEGNSLVLSNYQFSQLNASLIFLYCDNLAIDVSNRKEIFNSKIKLFEEEQEKIKASIC